MRKILYLHIGTFKTGSSSLQQFLVDNRSWFGDQGYLVPAESIKEFHEYSTSMITGISGFRANGWETSETCHHTIWKGLQQQITDSSCHSIIISSEMFCDVMHPQVQEKAPEIKDWLRKQFANFDVKVICYLRPLDKYIKSFYKELVKGSSNYKNTFSTFIKDTLDEDSIHISPTKYLKFYEELFGREALFLRKYERNELINKSIVNDFLGILKLNKTESKNSSIERNISLPDSMIDIKLILNTFNINSTETNNDIITLLQKLGNPAYHLSSTDSTRIRAKIKKEHSIINSVYNINLGQVSDCLYHDGSAPDLMEEQKTRIMIALLWKEIQELKIYTNIERKKLSNNKKFKKIKRKLKRWIT